MNWRGLLETLTITLAAIVVLADVVRRVHCAGSVALHGKWVSPLDIYDAHLQGRLRHAHLLDEHPDAGGARSS